MKYLAILFVLGAFAVATPAYALERGTGSYIEYLIAKIEQEGTTSTAASASVSTQPATSTRGATYQLQPAMPSDISNWLRSVRTFSITTTSPSVSSSGGTFGGSAWGGMNMDVNSYHIIGDTGGDVQKAYDIIR